METTLTKTIITKRDNGSRRVQLELNQDSHVEQHHVGDTNINEIMKKYQQTGQLPDPVLHAVYGDFTGAEDFHTSNNKIIAARELFGSLPADIRTFFTNDPAELLEFVNDPDNLEEARKMGLMPLAPKPELTELEKAKTFLEAAAALEGEAKPRFPDESAEPPPEG